MKTKQTRKPECPENSAVLRTLLSPVNLDDTLDGLAADRTQVHLLGTGHARADVATVAENGVLLLGIADLAEIRLFISHLPVADTLAVSLAILVAADILVASLLFDIGALSMAHILNPITVISVTCRIFHLAWTMAPTEDKIALIDGSRA